MCIGDIIKKLWQNEHRCMRDIIDLLVLVNDESLQAVCDRNISWKTLDKLPHRWLVFSQCCPFVAVRFIKHRTSNPAGDSSHTKRKIKPKKLWKRILFLYFLENHTLVLLVRLALLSFLFPFVFSLSFVCVNVGIWFSCFRSRASTLPAHTFRDCG